MVEDIIDLPSQLNLALLSDLYVLKDRDVVIEDRRQSNQIARQIPNVSLCCRLAKAGRVHCIGQPGDVRCADGRVGIAEHHGPRVYVATSEIRDAGVSTGRGRACLQGKSRSARLTGRQVSLTGADRVGPAAVGRTEAGFWFTSRIRSRAGNLVVIQQ